MVLMSVLPRRRLVVLMGRGSAVVRERLRGGWSKLAVSPTPEVLTDMTFFEPAMRIQEEPCAVSGSNLKERLLAAPPRAQCNQGCAGPLAVLKWDCENSCLGLD